MKARSENGTSQDMKPYRIVAVLWLLVFVAGSQVLIMAPILPRIGDQLAASESLLGTLITAYAVAVGVFALIAGPISDRIGRRRILLVGNTIMASALLLHGAVWDFASLFAVRMLAGVAGGILNGAALAYVGDFFPRKRRGWANGWVTSGIAAGLIAGVPVGTMAADRFGFRVPFVVFGGLLVVALVLLWRYVPQPDVRRAEPLTLRGALRGYAVLLRRREGQAAIVIFVIMFAGNALYLTYLPAWLEATLGVGGGVVGTMFFFGGLAATLAAPQAGRLSDRIGRRPLIVAASLGLGVVTFATPHVITGAWVAYGLFFVVEALFAARAAPFKTLLTEMVSSERRGAFINLTIGMGQVGAGVGGGLAGAAYAGIGYEGTTAITAFAMLLIGVMVWRLLPETLHRSGEEASPERGGGKETRVCGAVAAE